MQSECAHGKGQFYSTVQHQNTIGPRSSSQIVAVTPLPWVHSHNAIQNNMVATQYPEALGVAYRPARLQTSFAQSQNNLQGLHHQQESQATTVSTGSQPPTLANTKTALNSSAHVTVGHGGYYRTSIHGCSARQSVNESEQRREYSKGQFSRLFLNGSNLNKTTGLQQRQHLNCEFSACGNSAALQEDSLEVAKTLPKVQGSSVTAQERCPMLLETDRRLTGNLIESKSFSACGSSPEESNANMALNTNCHDAEQGPHESVQVDGSLTALDCGQTRTQALHHSEGSSVQVYSASHRLQTSNERFLPVGETKPPTKKDIHAHIKKKLAHYYDYLMRQKQNKNYNKFGRDSTLLSMPSHPHTTAASKEDVVIHDHYIAIGEPSVAVGKALEEEASKSSKPNAASEKHSTEYPQIMQTVASTMNETESPGVPTAVPGMTWKDQRKKRPGFKLNCNLSHEESRLSWLNVNTNSKDMEIGPGVLWGINHCTEREKGSAARNNVETVRLDNTQDITEQKKSSSESGHVSLELSSLTEYQNEKKEISNENSQHHRVISKEGTAISNSSVCNPAIPNMLSIPTNQSEEQSSQTRCAREDTSQAISGKSVPVKELQKHALLSKGMVKKADPLYEDISDDGMPDLTTELPTTDPLEFSAPACFDDASKAESKAVDTATPTLVAAPSFGHGQGHAQIETLIAQPCSCSFYFERRYCPKCDGGTQTVSSASSSPSSVLDIEDETDDEMDDDHLAIPISIFDLKYEPEDENQDSSETNVPEVVETGAYERPMGTSTTRCPSPTAFTLVPVFDTPECFLQAVQCETIYEMASGSIPLVHETDSEGAVLIPEKRRASVDSCDTEDSCDYSPASEHNFLTVARTMGNKVTNIPEDQLSCANKLRKRLKPRRTSEAKHGSSKHSSTVDREDIIVLDSDTEDESVQICKNIRERKRKPGCPPSLEDISDASCSQPKRHSPGSEAQKNMHLSVCSPTAPRQSRDDPVCEEEMQDVCSDASQSAGKREQLIQTKDVAVHVPHKTHIPKSSPVEGVIIIIDSDAEDDYPQSCEKLSRAISVVSANDNTPCVGPETAYRGCGPAEAKLQEMEPSLPDSPQRQSNLQDTHFRGAMQGAPSYQPPSEQLVSEHVPHQAHKQSSKRGVGHRASKEVVEKGNSTKKAVSEGMTSSVSEGNHDVTQGSPDESADRLCGTANAGPVVSRFLAQPSGKKGCLKLLKELVVRKQHRGESSSVQTPTSLKAFSLPFNPREHSFPPKPRWPYSSSATLAEPTKGPAQTVQLNAPGYAKEQVNGCSPNRRDRRCSLATKDIRRRPGLHDKAGREMAPRKPRQSHKAPTSMMKKATNDAIQWTKNRKPVSKKERRNSVGEGYKWAEKSNVAKLTKGPSRERMGR
ncbi:uncharacterized protein LOC134102891 [Pungitius pungitius]|uniref:uncharacterized protein LOC134102891 n=1 Tax=Pungitius pungitius TaxID=134920 RepID=UPI002E12FD2B